MVIPTTPHEDINLSFSGCGFIGLYHVGVAQCFREYAPEVLSGKVCGTSAGALVAAAVVCDLDLDVCTERILEIARFSCGFELRSLSAQFDIKRLIHNLLDELLPDDCHEKANGRLFISVTRVKDFKNVMISEYNCKEDVIQTVLCSCFIPVFFMGSILKINGEEYIDGAFTANQPILNDHTITVSPFYSVSTDISPKNPNIFYDFEIKNSKIGLTIENLYLFWSVIVSPNADELRIISLNGYNHAYEYLQIENFDLRF